MLRLLLDANLSPETADFLRQQFGFDVLSLMESSQTGLLDTEVVELAADTGRVIVTFDLDFGSMYHDTSVSQLFGCIIMRLHDQRIENANEILKRFFQSQIGKIVFIDYPHALVVLTETGVRVVK